MYEDFYRLRKNPFQLNADIEFFYNSKIHQKALTYMRYGITKGEGFIVITGTPGTGKTLLVKQLVNSLNKDKVAMGVIVSSQVGANDLLGVIATAFGMPKRSENKAELLANIERFFIEQVMSGKKVLLIIDEAQNLPKDALEELRMLSNFERNGRLLLQTFLVGQTQLTEKLVSPEMEQFSQRIVATCQLKPFNEEETRNYILFRLKKVGWQKNPEFTEEVFSIISEYCQGIPRRINGLCDRLFLFGYLEELRLFDGEQVRKVIADIEEEAAPLNESYFDMSDPELEENVAVNGSLEQRVAALENTIAKLRQALGVKS